jgi:hypothetical protein
VLAQPAAVRRALGHGNPGAHGDRLPAEVAHHLRREASVAIDRPDQTLHVDDLRLQLDDEQRPGRSQPGHDVDHPALAPDRERTLRDHLPPGRGEGADDELVHRGVPGVQEAVELRAVPAQDDVEVRLQRHGNGLQLPHPNPGEVAALHGGDHGARHLRAAGDLLLRGVRPDADCPEASSDS